MPMPRAAAPIVNMPPIVLLNVIIGPVGSPVAVAAFAPAGWVTDRKLRELDFEARAGQGQGQLLVDAA